VVEMWAQMFGTGREAGGARVAILVTDGFEQSELEKPPTLRGPRRRSSPR
jgi:hypothetical protein